MVDKKRNYDVTHSIRDDWYEEARNAYDQYVLLYDDSAFERILSPLDNLYRNTVMSRLSESVRRDEQKIADIFGNIHQKIFKLMKNHRDHPDLYMAKFVNYCASIYYGKTVDYIREMTSQKSYYTNETSLLDAFVKDQNNTEGDLTLGETATQAFAFADASKYGDLDDLSTAKVNEHINRLTGKLLDQYLYTMLDLKHPCVHLVSLVYSRILPHIHRSIPDTRAADAGKAIEIMGNRPVKDLRRESEDAFVMEFSDTMHWGKPFIDDMEVYEEKEGEKFYNADIRPATAFSKSKIEDMAESTHVKVVKHFFQSMDDDTFEYAILYAQMNHPKFKKALEKYAGRRK